ncbi:hypothetical protein O988_09635 [Pseudogymnoascus sp. VKM F-3808]|nr:hypothetical protein O988_09635 [Pseudogymnoascus sp. VKM F-3808]
MVQRLEGAGWSKGGASVVREIWCRGAAAAAATSFMMALCEDEAPWFCCWPVLRMSDDCDWVLRCCCASIMVTDDTVSDQALHFQDG